MQEVLSMILGGGRGTRLYPLTKYRSKPAVPIAGKYRLIDIPISNCINSGLNRIFVLTQFLSVSLHSHIGHTYKFDPFGRGFVEVLAAQQTNEAADWYQGTADAVRRQLRYIEEDPCREVLILSGDQLYRMDFRRLVYAHRETGADVTLAVLPVGREEVSGFGIVRADDSGRLVGFVEKPKTDEQLRPVETPPDWLERRGIESRGRRYLASMGIYLFNRRVLLDLLGADPGATDFGKEVFPRSLQSHRVCAHLFDGYWEDLGTVGAYHQAHLALASDLPPFDFHTPEGVIYTRMRNLPASRVSEARLRHCLVSDGCLVEPGTRAERCVIGVRSRIGRGVTLRDTVLFGNSGVETETDRADNRRRNIPARGIGDGSVIQRAIVDKDARIGRSVQVVNRRGLQEADGDNYVIRDGIVVIPDSAIVPDGTVI
jgi:glucose-1-phosphate adenylyltransferase